MVENFNTTNNQCPRWGHFEKRVAVVDVKELSCTRWQDNRAVTLLACFPASLEQSLLQVHQGITVKKRAMWDTMPCSDHHLQQVHGRRSPFRLPHLHLLYLPEVEEILFSWFSAHPWLHGCKCLVALQKEHHEQMWSVHRKASFVGWVQDGPGCVTPQDWEDYAEKARQAWQSVSTTSLIRLDQVLFLIIGALSQCSLFSLLSSGWSLGSLEPKAAALQFSWLHGNLHERLHWVWSAPLFHKQEQLLFCVPHYKMSASLLITY